MNLADDVRKLKKDVAAILKLLMNIRSGGGGGGSHNLLSATHPDTAIAAPQRGDVITGQGSTPKWTRLVKGASGQVLLSDGTDALWGAVPVHHTRHESGGADAIKLDDLATPDNNADLNATIAHHGLLPILDDDPAHFLDGTGAWAAPPSAPLYFKGPGSLRYGAVADFGQGSTTWGAQGATLDGGVTENNQDEGPFRKHTIGTASRGGYRSSYFQEFRVNQSPSAWFRIMTDASIADMILWMGMADAVVTNNADDPTGMLQYACFCYSTTVSANWLFITDDNVAQNIVDTGLPVAVSTIYDFKIYLQSGGPAYWWVTPKGGATVSGNTALHLPPTSNDMGLICQGYAKTGTHYFNFCYMYYEATIL
jgi:hypothetical protein